MTEHMPGEPDADDRFVRLDDGDMHVVQDGKLGAPALLLIHGSAGSLASWDAVVPSLAGAFRVIRIDLLGCGRSATPADGYDIPTQARRVGTALDKLGVSRVTVIGHSGAARWPPPWPSNGPARWRRWRSSTWPQPGR
jgi:pimeloyl-ACP methyl ester carboxylesterase